MNILFNILFNSLFITILLVISIQNVEFAYIYLFIIIMCRLISLIILLLSLFYQFYMFFLEIDGICCNIFFVNALKID